HFFFLQEHVAILNAQESGGLGDVFKRLILTTPVGGTGSRLFHLGICFYFTSWFCQLLKKQFVGAVIYLKKRNNCKIQFLAF
ncbi:hypothetical protein HYQ61_1421, partial [Lactobacillus crispatus]|uniref:hypothetical protein n=1 Tax=Lactobacillus crispatus TaxID=47770 RepID=UPI001E2CC0E5